MSVMATMPPVPVQNENDGGVFVCLPGANMHVSCHKCKAEFQLHLEAPWERELEAMMRATVGNHERGGEREVGGGKQARERQRRAGES